MMEEIDNMREMTRGEQRAAHKMLMILQDGDVVVSDFGDITKRYRNYRWIPEHSEESKELLDTVVGDYLGNCNWLEESRTHPGNAKARMKPFFLNALEERAERDGGIEYQRDNDSTPVIWEDIRNDNNRIISWVSMNGTTKAHDFWFATNEDYNHKWSIENDEKYYHKWMMENDEDYKDAYEAEQAAKEDA